MDNRQLTITAQNELAEANPQMTLAGQVANSVAASHTFDDYLSRKAENTITRQSNDLGQFAAYLLAAGISSAPSPWDLQHDPQAWQGITWGLVEGFVKWQLGQGFAVSSVNVRLSTVKTYANLAAQAKVIPEGEAAAIRGVSGYSRKEAKRTDKQRETTRKSTKKEAAVNVSFDQAEILKSQPTDNAQGRRDNLLMCLLIEHGMRVSEVVDLQVSDFDLSAGKIRFYRRKIDEQHTHEFTKASGKAIREYFKYDAPAMGALLLGSTKSGKLTGKPMSIRAIQKRVKALGEAIGIDGLSPHDLRHYGADRLAEKGKSTKEIMDWGGWTSPAMAIRYQKAAEVKNTNCDMS